MFFATFVQNKLKIHKNSKKKNDFELLFELKKSP